MKLLKSQLREMIREDLLEDSFINMIKLIDILVEAKQVGPLYHIMDKSSFIFNIKNDKIGNNKDDNISFSRSKSFASIPRHLPKNKVFAKFTINGNKLSNNYKIFPVDDRYYKSKRKDSFDWLFENQEDEYEERVIGVINNIGKYITKIEIFKSIDKDKETKKLLEQYLKKYPNIKTDSFIK
jgi:hypothetical protein